MLARRYEFYVLVAGTISHEWAQRTSEILFLPLEHKIHIFSPPCNILYILVAHKPITTLRRLYSYLIISRTKTNRRTDRELVKPAETWARDWPNTNAKRATRNGDVNSYMYCWTPFTDERSNRMVAKQFPALYIDEIKQNRLRENNWRTDNLTNNLQTWISKSLSANLFTILSALDIINKNKCIKLIMRQWITYANTWNTLTKPSSTL